MFEKRRKSFRRIIAIFAVFLSLLFIPAAISAASSSTSAWDTWLRHSLPYREIEASKQSELSKAYKAMEKIACQTDAYQFSKDSLNISMLDNSPSKELNEALIQVAEDSNSLAWASYKSCQNFKSTILRESVTRDLKSANAADLKVRELVFSMLKS